jgi:hypothetical protein
MEGDLEDLGPPNKMKIHLWRFAHDCLPSGVQMIRRQIPTTDACVFFGREEDIEHASLINMPICSRGMASS